MESLMNYWYTQNGSRNLFLLIHQTFIIGQTLHMERKRLTVSVISYEVCFSIVNKLCVFTITLDTLFM